MATTRDESKMIEEVRRWRAEAYARRSMQTLEERAAEERKLAQEFGLRVMDPKQMVRPPIPSPPLPAAQPPTRKAG